MTGPQQIADHWPAIRDAFASEGVTIQLEQALGVLPKLVAAMVAPAEPPPAAPTIDLSTVQIVNAPDVRSWSETTRITQVSFNNGVTRIAFTKQEGTDRWPDVRPPGWDGDIQYTMWLFLKINDQWVGSGFIQMWHGRDGSGSAGDPDVPSRFHDHWFYSARWDPLHAHGPIQPGEDIGFMVTSGNARDSRGPYGPLERSNAVIVKAADDATYNF